MKFENAYRDGQRQLIYSSASDLSWRDGHILIRYPTFSDLVEFLSGIRPSAYSRVDLCKLITAERYQAFPMICINEVNYNTIV